MMMESFSADWIQTPCDALVIAIDDDWRARSEIQQLDQATHGWITRLMGSGDVPTKPNKVTLFPSPPGLATGALVLVGTGNQASVTGNTHFRAAAAALKGTMTRPRAMVRMVGFGVSPFEERSAVAGAIVGCSGQDLYRAEKALFAPEAMQWVGCRDASVAAGQAIGESINLTRRLINMPPNYLYPESFVSEAEQVAQRCGISVEVWDRERLETENCGALLGVARGSVRDPRLMILRYHGAADSSAPVALVGKGVTFDSGGYSIKPSDGMMGMKADMSGAATVLGIFRAAAKLQVKRNLVGVVGLVENLISGDAFKLGDVLTARSGKTIEIHNTDAEGRLVLADCLNVALDLKPSKIVDFATLTGACVIALGNEISGLMSNDPAWQQEIQNAADACGEYTWPLPMHPFFKEQIASKVADIKNVGEGRYGGAITAAKFLEEFVDGKPWTHIDIAGPAFSDSGKPWCDAGATGALVRSFAEWSLL
jgi:leucyl aminopeptidase